MGQGREGANAGSPQPQAPPLRQGGGPQDSPWEGALSPLEVVVKK